MAPNSLFPAAFVLSYRTVNAPHTMTVPVNEWAFPSGGHDQGTFLAWDDTQVDADTMITGFIALLAPFWPSTTHFTDYQINTYDDELAPARPQIRKSITPVAGTGGATIPAAQATFNFKTTGFGTFKIVMLDARVSSTFQPLEALVTPTNDDEIDLVDYILDDTNAFRGRDNLQPSIMVRVTYTLNEKLRDSYHLS